MDWIENGYKLFWNKVAPAPSSQKNAQSVVEDSEFVSEAIFDMLEAGAVSELPVGARPLVVSPPWGGS